MDYDLSGRLGILPEHLSLMRSSALPLSHTTSRIESVTLMRLGRLLNFMKSLTDQGIDFETEAAGDLNKNLSLENRQETGIRFLQMFLTDGKIRGITPDGRIYEHEVSLDLTRRFRDVLRSIKIKGVTG
jgi:hypothetical protein